MGSKMDDATKNRKTYSAVLQVWESGERVNNDEVVVFRGRQMQSDTVDPRPVLGEKKKRTIDVLESELFGFGSRTLAAKPSTPPFDLWAISSKIVLFRGLYPLQVPARNSGLLFSRYSSPTTVPAKGDWNESAPDEYELFISTAQTGNWSFYIKLGQEIPAVTF